MATKNKNYAQIALRYAQDVVGGKILACQWVIKACQRHLNDLGKASDAKYRYRFDAGKAFDVCFFIEQLKHVKGAWAGQQVILEPWQVFSIACVFGWVEKETGYRRFKAVYEEEPRKNAKSTKVAGVALYMLVADGEAGAEVYSTATTGDQASIVFSIAQQMARKCEFLAETFGLQNNAHNLFVQETGSKFKALNAEGSSLDGLNTHFNSNDELHAHKDRALFDVMRSSMGSRKQGLMWNITTAGTNLIGVCYEQRAYLTKILDGVIEDDSFFGIIYTIDDGDDWRDPKIWAKANPNLDVSVFISDMESECLKAINSPASLNNFLTKKLNVWCNANTSWMNMTKWQECANQDLRLSDFAGKPCYVALDLASKIDIAAKVKLFPIDGGKRFAVFGNYYIPEAMLEKKENINAAQYHAWVRQGHMIATPGNIIDYEYIKDDLLEDARNFEVAEIAYDPFQATQFVIEMGKEGLTMIEVGATVKNFSEPMKRLEALAQAGLIEYDGDPVLTWMMSCVTAHYDKKENIFPNKESRDAKIDGVVALIMALNRAQLMDDVSDELPVYESGGVTIL